MTDPKRQRLLTFRSGGWVILLTVFVGVVVVAMTVIPAWQRMQARPPGDGRDPATYGFALEPTLVPRASIVAGQLHRDLVPALVTPAVLPADGVGEANRRQRGKYLVGSDRVIGVEVAGESRAYPILVLSLHEIVNDELGGVPIAITYNPLCDSVVVFERRLDPGSEPLEFGVSGLLYNSNLLLYDRRADGDESLWSQLQHRAIAGPYAAAGATLRLVPAELGRWDDWSTRHPETTVIDFAPESLARYRETSYASYLRSDELLFPVDPPPPPDGPPAKTPCVIVDAGGVCRVYPIPAVIAAADADGLWEDTLGPATLQFHARSAPDLVRVTVGGEAATTRYALWFAAHALGRGCERAGE
ncbi:MAG: DUF3179 domain-containing protein [Phycisphaerales bacterium]|nr:DUF3179 domain-containing protein [Phycisphaerae bacterium]NNF44613.1 DUF3179 domain-containing protein [Phycisphaerales bacterium]NNM25360.1 DUF3179 domain-containing protein [Phycisphaerales bacterium]